VSLILAERPGASTPKSARTASPIVDHRRVHATVQRAYAKIALFPRRTHPVSVGRTHALALGYPREALGRLPALAVESFCGVAYPVDAMAVRVGDVVVDVGAGSGVDALLAAHLVGPLGQVVGIELTEELFRKAARAAGLAKATNLRFERGSAEDLPLPGAFADVVLANGVINLLVADKDRALAEAWRVLKPGGRIVLADVVVPAAAPLAERAVPERWATDLAGPVDERELLDLLGEAGFSDVEVRGTSEPFARTVLAETAPRVGATGVLVVAHKTRGRHPAAIRDIKEHPTDDE